MIAETLDALAALADLAALAALADLADLAALAALAKKKKKKKCFFFCSAAIFDHSIKTEIIVYVDTIIYFF